MARGWESKAVEAQIEAAERGERDQKTLYLSPAEARIAQAKQGLQLSRTRVLNDIRTARNPRYRKMLEEALVRLERELAALDCPQQ
jgi:hypothetical protein